MQIFRSRVAGILRDMGKIIEAHEVRLNACFEDDEDVMTGIMGAVAQSLQGRSYGSRGERQVGDDFAAGTFVRFPKPELDGRKEKFDGLVHIQGTMRIMCERSERLC